MEKRIVSVESGCADPERAAEADDLHAVMKATLENIKKQSEAGRMSDLLKTTATSSYRRTCALSR